MINLSSRLKIMAQEIKEGETMADIGTDHGFLPISLWEKKVSPHVIMTDVSKGSLDKARDNCTLLHQEADFDLRLGNGLEVLDNGEVDVVTIAGMGGLLIVDLMAKNLAKSKSYKKFILQPRSSILELRKWLWNNDFSIEKEQLVEEGKFICEILTVVTEKKETPFQFIEEPKTDIEWEVPSYYREIKTSLKEEFILRKIQREEKILSEKLKSNNAEKIVTKNKIEYLKGLLEVK